MLVAWDAEDCRKFIVAIIGHYETLPRQYSYYEGTHQVLRRLRNRYGVERYNDFTSVFTSFLDHPGDDESSASIALWSAWRAEFSITGV